MDNTIYIYLVVIAANLLFVPPSCTWIQNTKIDKEAKTSATQRNCLEEDFPKQATWQKVTQYYKGCGSFGVEIKETYTIQQFIQYLRIDDKLDKHLKKKEADLIQNYYWQLKLCSECETTDCYDCDCLKNSCLKQAKELFERKFTNPNSI